MVMRKILSLAHARGMHCDTTALHDVFSFAGHDLPEEAAFGLGATRWQALWRIVLPAASPGIIAAVMLGIGRVIGETMVVMMVTGNSPVVPASILQPLRTLTATIAGEMGETVSGSEHYFALFAVGLVLFIITFIINFIADSCLRRARK
jgi:phosphate transport system permease protein